MRLLPIFRNELPYEAKRWLAAQIIDQVQFTQILNLYGLDSEGRSQRSLALQTLSALGGVLIILAVILLVGKNWEQIPASLRIIGLCSSTLFLNVWGFLALKQDKQSLGKLLLLLGSGMYGACIFLISQIFHLSGSLPMALLAWAVGVLPIAIATNSLRFILLIQAILIPYVCWDNTYEGPMLYYLVTSIALWVLVLRQDSTLSFLIQLVCSVIALNRLLPVLDYRLDTEQHVFFTIGVGACFHIFSELIGRHRTAKHENHIAVTQLWAVRLALLSLFFYSLSADLLEEAKKLFLLEKTFLLGYFGILGLLLFGLIGKSRELLLRHYAAFLAIASSITLPVLGCLIYSLFSDHPAQTTVKLLSDLSILATAVAFIMQGRRDERSALVIFGALLISVLGLARYINLVGDYLGTSAIFCVEGVFLILLARHLSHNKKELAAI